MPTFSRFIGFSATDSLAHYRVGKGHGIGVLAMERAVPLFWQLSFTPRDLVAVPVARLHGREVAMLTAPKARVLETLQQRSPAVLDHWPHFAPLWNQWRLYIQDLGFAKLAVDTAPAWGMDDALAQGEVFQTLCAWIDSPENRGPPAHLAALPLEAALTPASAQCHFEDEMMLAGRGFGALWGTPTAADLLILAARGQLPPPPAVHEEWRPAEQPALPSASSRFAPEASFAVPVHVARRVAECPPVTAPLDVLPSVDMTAAGPEETAPLAPEEGALETAAEVASEAATQVVPAEAIAPELASEPLPVAAADIAPNIDVDATAEAAPEAVPETPRDAPAQDPAPTFVEPVADTQEETPEAPSEVSDEPDAQMPSSPAQAAADAETDVEPDVEMNTEVGVKSARESTEAPIMSPPVSAPRRSKKLLVALLVLILIAAGISVLVWLKVKGTGGGQE